MSLPLRGQTIKFALTLSENHSRGVFSAAFVAMAFSLWPSLSSTISAFTRPDQRVVYMLIMLIIEQPSCLSSQHKSISILAHAEPP